MRISQNPVITLRTLYLRDETGTMITTLKKGIIIELDLIDQKKNKAHVAAPQAGWIVTSYRGEDVFKKFELVNQKTKQTSKAIAKKTKPTKKSGRVTKADLKPFEERSPSIAKKTKPTKKSGRVTKADLKPFEERSPSSQKLCYNDLLDLEGENSCNRASATPEAPSVSSSRFGGTHTSSPSFLKDQATFPSQRKHLTWNERYATDAVSTDDSLSEIHEDRSRYTTHTHAPSSRDDFSYAEHAVFYEQKQDQQRSSQSSQRSQPAPTTGWRNFANLERSYNQFYCFCGPRQQKSLNIIREKYQKKRKVTDDDLDYFTDQLYRWLAQENEQTFDMIISFFESKRMQHKVVIKGYPPNYDWRAMRRVLENNSCSPSYLRMGKEKGEHPVAFFPTREAAKRCLAIEASYRKKRVRFSWDEQYSSAVTKLLQGKFLE